MGCQRHGYIIMEKCANKNKGWASTRQQCTSVWQANRSKDQNFNRDKIAFSGVYCTIIERNRQQTFARWPKCLLIGFTHSMRHIVWWAALSSIAQRALLGLGFCLTCEKCIVISPSAKIPNSLIISIFYIP